MSKLPPKLQRVIDRFVDDFLDAIREMAFEELVQAVKDGPPQRTGKPAPTKRRAAPRRRRPAAAPAKPRATDAALSAPIAAEITDPLGLLEAGLVAATTPAEPAVLDEEPPRGDTVDAPPPDRRLRGDEAVARDTAAGLVIRRVRQ
jgi:hypothetical protein